MAFYQSITGSVRRKGQTALQCGLCEKNPKIEWKCLECEFMMCQRCRDKVHPKFPSAEDHTIIDIKEISKHQTDSGPKPDLTRIKCEEHSGQTCCLFCKTCQELVCNACITKTHKKHEFGDIIEEYNIKIEKIKHRRTNFEKKMQTLPVSEQKLKQIKLNEQSNYYTVKQEIFDYEKALVYKIKKHTEKLITDLDKKWEAFSKSLNHEENKLKNNRSQIQKQIQEINTLLRSSNAKDVFLGSDSLLKSIERYVPIKVSCKGVPKFNPGDQTNNPLVLAKLDDVSIQINTTELHVNKRYDTYLKYITSVVSCPDGSLWLCDDDAHIVQKVSLNMNNVFVTSNISMRARDATLLPSGVLLLSYKNLSSLDLELSGSIGIEDSVFTVSPLYPTAVHVTSDNKVLVGAVDSLAIPATGPRQVIVMDQTGHHEKVLQFDRYNKPLFTLPHKITNNSHGNIAVVDFIYKDWRGKVIILNKEGVVKNIYRGHPDVNNKDNPFTPGGIKTTPSDNFVVADPPNHTLHILNSKGEFIIFYNTKEMGILLPYSFSFSTTGQLYIGCGTYKGKEKAKLYKIDKFPC